MAYSGSCHCGAVTFKVEGEVPSKAISCDCSHCRRKGFLWSFLPAKQFELTGGEDNLTEYRFNKRVLSHRFCKDCGCQAFAEGEQNGEPTRAVNLRCVPDCDLDALEIQKVEGSSF